MAQEQNPLVPPEKLRRIIQQGDAGELVQQAETIGTQLGRKKDRSNEAVVTTNQIRAIFSTVRQIEMNWPLVNARAEQQEKAERDLKLLKPKMVYRAARENSADFRRFSHLMGEAIDLVLAENPKPTRARFGYFVDFFEAILAYHKAESESKQGGRQ